MNNEIKPFFKVSCHALIKKDDRFLITRRCPKNDYMPGKWDTPGGNVEFEENILQCINREVMEESHLSIKINKPIFVHDHINGSRHQVEVIYDCDYQSGDVRLNPEEHDKYQWVTLKEMEEFPKIAFLEELFKFIQQQP